MKSLVRYLIIGGAVLIVLLLLLVGGGLLLRPQLPAGEPPSPVHVTLLYPVSGDEFAVGDYLTVTAQAIAPETLVSTELFVDGQSIGAITDGPQLASWPWQAWPVGLHTLQARVTDDKGQTGDSQTVIVNVLPGDGAMQVAAGPGQTLEQIGAAYGVPPDQMAGGNPQLDPSQPLQDGQPVKVPTGGESPGGGAGGVPGGGAGGFNPELVITWQFKPTGPADKSYCYTSTGNGAWEKMPKKVFEFFLAPENVFKQVFESLPNQQTVIQMQCWAWFGGTLKYLGQGETSVDVAKPPSQVAVSGEGFQFVGTLNIPSDEAHGGPTVSVPPPYALREAKDAAECTSHGHPFIALICDPLMQAKVQEHYILIWEWQPKTCWPGYCLWDNEIGSYRVFEIDPFTKTEKLLKEVPDPNNKMAVVPLPWGAKCYGVRAYAKDPAPEASEMATYCPGEPPKTEKVTLTATEWLTTDSLSVDAGCSNYGLADRYTLANEESGFGNSPGQVMVGALLVHDFGCLRAGTTNGAVRFGLLSQQVPAGAVLVGAKLRFSDIISEHEAAGVAGYNPETCVGAVGKAKQSWTGLANAAHFSKQNVLGGTAYYAPIGSIAPYPSPSADVTSAVNDWMKNPASNHGLILVPAGVPNPQALGASSCDSGLGNVVLEIEYIAP